MAESLPELKAMTDQVKVLIQGRSGTDPRLYDAITLLADQLQTLSDIVVPIAKAIGITVETGTVPLAPIGFEYQVLETGAIRLSWIRPPLGASYSFEVRAGEVWETAQFITRTQSTVVDVVPIPGQSNIFLLKSISGEGVYSATAASVTVIVEPPGAVGLEGQVIDNNVLLKWTPSISTFSIDYYEVFRGSVSLGRVKGTFAAFFELLAGEYVYSVVPVDIIGNRGQTSMVTLLVNQPPDYVLTSSIVSKFQGTRNRVLLLNDPLLSV